MITCSCEKIYNRKWRRARAIEQPKRQKEHSPRPIKCSLKILVAQMFTNEVQMNTN